MRFRGNRLQPCIRPVVGKLGALDIMRVAGAEPIIRGA